MGVEGLPREFAASRWTRGNHLFPTRISVNRERVLRMKPRMFGNTEESIAIAKERGGMVLSNESRVAHCCQQYKIPCLRFPAILSALWVEGIISKQEVQDIIAGLQVEDRMQFKQSTLDAILAD